MSTPSAKYFIYSKLGDRPNVGIWWLLKEQEQQGVNGQPVRIKADLVEWVATPPISGGGRYCLGPGPYKHSIELEGEVLATNNPDPREWFLTPVNEKDQSQLFKIVPILE